MALDFNDILQKLMPLFERKLSLLEAAQERALTAQEKSDEKKYALEEKKLAAQIKSDEDKLAWEREKATLGFKHGMNFQTLINQGHLDLERLKQAGAKDVAIIQASAAKYGHDVDAIPKLLTAGAEQKVKNADGSETTISKSKEATGIGSRLAGTLGLAEPAKPEASQDAQKQAEIASVLSDYNNLKKTDPARAEAYLNSIKASAPDLHAALAPAIGQAPAPAATPAGQQQAAPPTAAQQLAATSQPQPQRTPLNAGEILTMSSRQPTPAPVQPQPQPQMTDEQITAAFARQGQQATPTLNEMMGLQARTQGTNPPASVGGMNMGGVIPQRPAMQPFQQAAIAAEEKKKKRSRLLNSTPSVL